MTTPTFEFLPEEKARIGDAIVKVCRCDPPLDGKWRYSIDATSDEMDTISQKLSVHQLRDVRPPHLPNGIVISIQRPRTEFRELQFVDIRKIDDRSEMHATMVFDFVDWHLPINLQHFAKNYCDAMLKIVEGAVATHIIPTEVGLFITCEVVVSPATNYWSAYRNIDIQVLETYRKCIADTYKPQNENPVQALPMPGSDASGTKWWVRHVLVPIVGSGAFAAAMAGLITFLK